VNRRHLESGRCRSVGEMSASESAVRTDAVRHVASTSVDVNCSRNPIKHRVFKTACLYVSFGTMVRQFKTVNLLRFLGELASLSVEVRLVYRYLQKLAPISISILSAKSIGDTVLAELSAILFAAVICTHSLRLYSFLCVFWWLNYS